MSLNSWWAAADMAVGVLGGVSFWFECVIVWIAVSLFILFSFLNILRSCLNGFPDIPVWPIFALRKGCEIIVESKQQTQAFDTGGGVGEGHN
jgi:hypothetical protein